MQSKKNFQIILVIISSNFTTIYDRFDLSQVRWNFIPGIKNFVNELLHELPNELRLSILQNLEMLEKSQKTFTITVKRTQHQILKVF